MFKSCFEFQKSDALFFSGKFSRHSARDFDERLVTWAKELSLSSPCLECLPVSSAEFENDGLYLDARHGALPCLGLFLGEDVFFTFGELGSKFF